MEASSQGRRPSPQFIGTLKAEPGLLVHLLIAMTYKVNIRTEGGESLGATYDAPNKTIVPVDPRITIESGDGYWALLLNDEYVLLTDSDGVSIGDICLASPGASLVFYAQGCGFQNTLAILNQQGMLSPSGDVFEVDALDEFNLQDKISFASVGVKITALKELWLLTNESGQYITSDGLLIAIPYNAHQN